MSDFVEYSKSPVTLDVIEGLLNLCIDREKEIAKLTGELAVLKAGQENLLAAYPDDAQRSASVSANHGVLVVDDSDVMRNKLVNLLLNNGYRVIGEAENGLKAVQLYKERRPTVVTMDIDMPVMDGFEATRQIKRIDPNARIIVVSQVLDSSMILNALGAGAVDFLVKPVQIDRLLNLIRRLAGPPTQMRKTSGAV